MIKKEVVIENCTISNDQGLHQQKATLKMHLISESLNSGYFSFPLSSKTNISNFQFDLAYREALYYEPGPGSGNGACTPCV